MMRKSLVVLALAVLLPLTLAAANEGQPQYKLGGTFIGHSSTGNLWNSLQTPLDPAGRTAALRVNLTTYSPDLAGLLAWFGADTVGESVGEQAMISRDTAEYRTVGYATAQGIPPQVRLIVVMTGTLQFTDPDNFTVNYTLDCYPASADSDGDGYPDPGAVPVVSVPGTDHARRVPIG
jgi:hypothetical protein